MDKQEPNLEGLKSFAHWTDRKRTPFFVGREGERERVMRQANILGEAHAKGYETEGETMIITGCPGSGKSTFLAHLAQTFAHYELTHTVVIPVRCNRRDLTARNSDELEAHMTRLAMRRKEGLHKTVQALLKDAGPALGLANTFQRLEEKINDKTNRSTVVCLLVDEIQNVTEANAPAIETLHTHSFSPPVLPVYAGLDNSAQRLKEVCGISRFAANAHMTMGALRKHAGAEATDELFREYRVRGDAATRLAWGETIEKVSLGFPQHLHVALQAACTVLIENEGHAHPEDMDEVEKRALTAREEYYAAKTDDIVDQHAQAMLDVVHQATGTKTRLTKEHLAQWAKVSMQKHSPLQAQYSNEEAFTLIETMRRSGILHLTAQGRAHVPIPSLHTWLKGAYAQHVGWQPPGRGRTHGKRTPGEH